jgi:hypothetical protein
MTRAEHILNKIATQTAAGVGGAVMGPLGAALGADPGKRSQTFLGSWAGSAGGALAGVGAYRLLKGKMPTGSTVPKLIAQDRYIARAALTGLGASVAGSTAGAVLAHGKTEKPK